MPENPSGAESPPVTTASRKSNQKSIVAMVLLWAPTVLAMLVVKYFIVLGSVFGGAITVVGLDHVLRWSDLSFLQRLSFWREDLLFAFVLAPIAAWGISVAGRYRAWIAGGLSFALFALLAVQFANYRVVGRFLGLELIVDSLRWGIDHPDDMKTYLGMNPDRSLFAPRNIGALVGLLALAGGGIALARLLYRRLVVALARPGLVRRNLPPALYGVALLLTIVSWYPWMKPTPLHSSSLRLAATALFGPGGSQSSEFSSLSDAQLQKRYRTLTFSPGPERSEYSGRAHGYDVILYVLETAPSRVLPADGDLGDMPNLRKLRERAWINTHHYTTIPVSNRAVFSIITSMYPTGGARLFRRGAKSIPGLMRSVGSGGYATAVYMPHAISFESEKKMYSMLGLNRVVLALANPVPAEVEQSRWRRREQEDESAFDLMLDDITRWHKEDRRYAVTFLPQIAHGPWIDISSDGAEKNVLRRGRALLRLQDRLLGRLIDRLQQDGRLEKTLIVVTGDHGIRTSVEDPSLHSGALDDYTFCVPLFVFAPGLLNSTTSLPWVTSHIDIAPTILDLLGVENGREFEQGTPIWDDRLKVRVTYLIASDYLGVDGYHQIDKFFAWNENLSAASQSSSLDAESQTPLAVGKPQYNGVKARIQALYSIQRTWFSRAIK